MTKQYGAATPKESQVMIEVTIREARLEIGLHNRQLRFRQPAAC
jgi:hypothetical protein